MRVVHTGVPGGVPAHIRELGRRAHELLELKKWKEAVRLFAQVQASGVQLEPAFYNNYALCLMEAGDLEKAWSVLARNLGPEAPYSPYGHALAARLLKRMGRDQEALQQLHQSVQEFEAGLKDSGPDIPVSWREYLVAMQRAAGELGQHELVLAIHKRWQHLYVTSENQFLAGAAAFNLGRFREAAICWQPNPKDPAWRILRGYARLAAEVEAGIAPPFQLPYEPPSLDGLSAAEKTGRVDGNVLALTLAFAAETGYTREELMDGLIRFTGDWGIQFAHNVIQSARTTMEAKQLAAEILVEMGAHPADEPFTCQNGKGETVRFRVKTLSIPDHDAHLEAQVEQALQLRREGKLQEAEKLLRGPLQQGIFYPRAVLNLANLLRSRGELEEAQKLLSALNELLPDNPRVLLNLASLYVQMGEVQEARRWYRRIRPVGESEEFKALYAELGQQIQVAEAIVSAPDLEQISEWARGLEEDKPVSINLPLATGLKRMPADWLLAACKAYGLPAAKRRRERERQLETHIMADPAGVVARLPAQAGDCLRYILDHGGWAKVAVLKRHFGSMEGDGFFWADNPPESVLGQLWLHCLLFIGRARVDGRQHEVAVIPVDLRAPLAEALRKP
ncbi:MAG: tetratricopeptide repeat protein [Firmicutes bacterium]|nr:tetratricopeptide repeat protein [Bacillota bacterium]